MLLWLDMGKTVLSPNPIDQKIPTDGGTCSSKNNLVPYVLSVGRLHWKTLNTRITCGISWLGSRVQCVVCQSNCSTFAAIVHVDGVRQCL
jgi:hypothetical protein